MRNSNPNFTYWKYRWQPWLLLFVAVLQLLLLWSGIHDYRIVLDAGIFSPEQLAAYIPQQQFKCVLSGILALTFLGIVLIGAVARSQRAARLLEGLLLLLLAGAMAAAGVVFHFYGAGGSVRFLWLFMLLLFLGGSLYAFFGRKQNPEESP